MVRDRVVYFSSPTDKPAWVPGMVRRGSNTHLMTGLELEPALTLNEEEAEAEEEDTDPEIDDDTNYDNTHY